MTWKHLSISWVVKETSTLKGKSETYLYTNIPSLLPPNWQLAEVEKDTIKGKTQTSLRFYISDRISEDTLKELEDKFETLGNRISEKDTTRLSNYITKLLTKKTSKD